jgi:hypothetical protein
MPHDSRRVAVAAAGAAALALVSAPPAAAQVPTLPLEVRGVSAVNAGPGTVRITFGDAAARLFRRVAGRSLTVRCERVGERAGPVLLREDRTGELVRTLTAPARRRPIRVRKPGARRDFDVCRLVALRPRNRSFRTVLSLDVPLTQAGAALLRDRALGDRMVALLDLVAGNASGDRYPAFAPIAAVVPRLVQLPSPDATPPPGRLGLFTDAAQHVTVVAVSVLGMRLFIDADGEILSTNVPELVAGTDD